MLSVIGAGLPRTGTLSLKRALEILGFGPCYHMSEFFRHPERWHCWEQAASGDNVRWQEIFEGYASTADAPACWFYKELAALYPDAKIILTVRDPDAWLKSAAATVFSPEYARMLAASPAHRISTLLGKRLQGITDVTPPDSPSNYQQHARAIFTAHDATVRAHISPHRLLVYSVEQGWPALCEFLGRTAPPLPFPHVNRRDEFFDWAQSFTAAK